MVRVPLNKRASTLINKYKGVDTQNRLFPFVSLQSYNNYIKEIFLLCGITRSVTVVDSVTGKEVQRPINEIASSHMARRSFVGNLYKKVKDPNLIASMSGHVEGSQAFTRYPCRNLAVILIIKKVFYSIIIRVMIRMKLEMSVLLTFSHVRTKKIKCFSIYICYIIYIIPLSETDRKGVR